MEEEKKKAYSEVIEILKLIEDEDKMEKIPFEVIELIKNGCDPAYKPQISKEIPLEEQNLREDTYKIIGWIANKYWGADIFELNNTKEERKILNAAVYNDIEPEIINREFAETSELLPVVVKDIHWFSKIKEKVIKFLKIIFRLNKGEETDRDKI